jgi:hypothetical protein
VTKKFKGEDRRKHPRLDGNIPLKIYSDDFDIVTETTNLSRNGVSCRVSKYIEPMTKLKIHLLLSWKKKGKATSAKISCDGVIVRTESVPQQEGFNVAIYFQDIKPKDAARIADFMPCTLEKTTPAE